MTLLPAPPARSRRRGKDLPRLMPHKGLVRCLLPALCRQNPECCAWTRGAVEACESVSLVIPKSHARVRRGILGLSGASGCCFSERTGRVSLLAREKQSR